MLKISRESEINLINVLIDNDVISGKDLINIKKKSSEGNKSQIEAVFDLKLTDEKKILDILVKEQNLEIIDLKNVEDSLSLARSRFPASSNSLDNLCKRFNIDLSRRTKHNAVLDCELLREVYINLLDVKEPRLSFNSQIEKKI